MWIEGALPFQGSVPQSAHSSRAGAEDAAPRALSQTVRYLSALKTYGGLTDAEAASRLGLERSSINARRRPLVKAGLVIADGFRTGSTGVKNVIWRAV
jgi:predicted transcriptional regulator